MRIFSRPYERFYASAPFPLPFSCTYKEIKKKFKVHHSCFCEKNPCPAIFHKTRLFIFLPLRKFCLITQSTRFSRAWWVWVADPPILRLQHNLVLFVHCQDFSRVQWERITGRHWYNLGLNNNFYFYIFYLFFYLVPCGERLVFDIYFWLRYKYIEEIIFVEEFCRKFSWILEFGAFSAAESSFPIGPQAELS